MRECKISPEWKKYYTGQKFQQQYIYERDDLGAVCADGCTVFKLWSPMAEQVILCLYRSGHEGDAYKRIPMEKGEKGVWIVSFSESLHGIYYDFCIVFDGRVLDGYTFDDLVLDELSEDVKEHSEELAFGRKTVRSADPYARACGLNGKRSMVVDLRQTDPEGWEADKAPAPELEDIIYEMHIKEFSWDVSGGFPEAYRGKYRAFTCADTTLFADGVYPTGIRYLQELGITHVQLMPIYDFGSVDEGGDPDEFNWGYDPVNYNVPEGSYSSDPTRGEVRIRECKEMIQALHKAGFRVIMDVVYNHTYKLDSWFQRTAPWYFYRVFEDGRISNGSACGNDMATERTMCANYIVNSILYWAEEYHIDGFRFDLMGLFDTALMNRIRYELDRCFGVGEKLMYGEPWAAGETAMEHNAVQSLKYNMRYLDDQIGMFCDNTRDTVKGSALHIRRAGFVNGAPGKEKALARSVRAWCLPRSADTDGGKSSQTEPDVFAPSQVITYVSVHDNQTLWDKLMAVRPDMGQEEAMAQNKMSAAIYMTCQGRLFLLSGEEFGRSKNGMENSYNVSIDVNRLDWKQAWKHRDLVQYYKGLIALRKMLPGLCDKTARAWRQIRYVHMSEQRLSFEVNNDLCIDPACGGSGTCANLKKNRRSPWRRLLVIYNGGNIVWEQSLQGSGWYILCDGDSSERWRGNYPVYERTKTAPGSVLILGQIYDEQHEEDIKREYGEKMDIWEAGLENT